MKDIHSQMVVRRNPASAGLTGGSGTESTRNPQGVAAHLKNVGSTGLPTNEYSSIGRIAGITALLFAGQTLSQKVQEQADIGDNPQRLMGAAIFQFCDNGRVDIDTNSRHACG